MQGKLAFTFCAVLGLALFVQGSPFEYDEELYRESRADLGGSSYSQNQQSSEIVGPSGRISTSSGLSSSNAVPASYSASYVPEVVSTYEYVPYRVIPAGYVWSPVTGLRLASSGHTYSSKYVATTSSEVPVAVPAVVPAAVVPATSGGNGGAGIGLVGDVSGGSVVGIGGDAGR